MPDAILRVGPFGGKTTSLPDYLNQPSSASVNAIPINCNKRSWSNDSWKYYVGGITSGQYKSVTANNATVSETLSPEGAFFEFEGINFAYQAAQSFTLSGTYSANCEDAQQDTVSFIIQTMVYTSDDGPIVFSDTADETISGSYSVTLPAAVKPMLASLVFVSESPGTATVTINGINPT